MRRTPAGLREAAPPPPARTRLIGMLFAAGGLLAIVSVALPHPARTDEGALLVLGAAAIALGLPLALSGRDVPAPVTHTLVALASAMVCAAILLSGASAGVFATMFFWIAAFAAYLFTARVAAAHVAWLLLCYGAVLLLTEDLAGYSPLTRLLLTAIGLAVVTGVTVWLVSGRRGAERRAERFFELSRDLLCTISRDGYFVSVNPAWAETLGYEADELRARPILDLVHPDDRERTRRIGAGAFGGDPPAQFENRCRARDASWRWIQWSVSFDPDDGHLYARGTDITDRKRTESAREQLVHDLDELARTDPLTRAPNRRWLHDELDRELARADRYDRPFTLAMLDLDHFKDYNDRHGHQAGDRLLRAIADHWRSQLRGSDFLARYGGEEFVVLLPDCRSSEAKPLVDRLLAAMPEEETGSAGIASWDRGEDASSLLARADSALYAAKAAGRARSAIAEAPRAVR